LWSQHQSLRSGDSSPARLQSSLPGAAEPKTTSHGGRGAWGHTLPANSMRSTRSPITTRLAMVRKPQHWHRCAAKGRESSFSFFCLFHRAVLAP